MSWGDGTTCAVHGEEFIEPCVLCVRETAVRAAKKEHPTYRGTNPLTSDLAQWWVTQAETEVEQTIAKASEYGGDDLEWMGQVLLDTMNTTAHPDVTPSEVAVAFYALGKITRIIGAYKEGRRPSNDSWLDLHVYAGMGIRVREVGKWPM